MTDLVKPNGNDILLRYGLYGRGTQAFYALVEETKYRDGQEMETAKVIVDTMLHHGRRFLLRAKGPRGGWYIISYDDAVTNTLLALAEVRKASGATASGSAAISETKFREMTGAADYGVKDILLGQGKGQRHPGNKYYRFLIRSKYAEYRSCSSNTEKAAMATLIVKQVNDDGYRFLKQQKDGLWYVVGDNFAIETVKKALGSRKLLFSGERSGWNSGDSSLIEAKEELKKRQLDRTVATRTFPKLEPALPVRNPDEAASNGSNSSIYTSLGYSFNFSQHSSSYSRQSLLSSKTSFASGDVEIEYDLGSNNGGSLNLRKNEDDDFSLDFGNDDDCQHLVDVIGDDSVDENPNRVCEPKSLITALSTTTINYYSVYHSLVRWGWISLKFDYRKECEVTTELENLFKWVYTALKSRQQVVIVVSNEDLMFFETNLKNAILEKYKIKNWEDAFEGTQIEIHMLGCSRTGELADSILHMLRKEGFFVFIGSDEKVRLFESYTQNFAEKCYTFQLGDIDPDQGVRVHMDWYNLLGFRPYDENVKETYFRLQYMLLFFCLHFVLTINQHVSAVAVDGT